MRDLTLNDYKNRLKPEIEILVIKNTLYNTKYLQKEKGNVFFNS